MIEVRSKIMDRMTENKDIIMRTDDWRDVKATTKYLICGKDFKEGNKKVRNHCYFTGKYRSHSLPRPLTFFFPVFEVC